MAIVRLPLSGSIAPILWHSSPWDGFAQPVLIDVNGEMNSTAGLVWNKTGADGKVISKVAFVMGSGLVKGTTTDIRVSLQNLAANGDPDEVADQSVLIGNANIASSTYIEVTLGSTRTVNYGEPLAVVWEFSTFEAGDLFRVMHTWGRQLSRFTRLASKEGGSWIPLSSAYTANVFLGFDDGTWGTFIGTTPCIASNISGIHTGTTPDEIALRVQVSAPLSVDGIDVFGNPTTDCDYDLVLYEDTTQLAKVSVDYGMPHTNYHIGGASLFDEGPQTLLPGHTYYAAIKPTTANSYNVPYIDVNAVAQWDAHAFGRECYWAQRSDAGAWSTTTTRRPIIALHLSGVDSGGGAIPVIGSGGLVF